MAQDTMFRILPSPPPDARLGPVHHVYNRVQPKSPKSLAEWQARAEHLRRHILACAGLDPFPERCPLEAEIFPIAQGEGFSVCAYRFQSLPGFWATGNLFVPEGDGPFPAVLNPHGHWDSGRLEHSERGSVPARGVAFARMGAVALTIDMVGYHDSDQVIHRFGGPREHLWSFGPLFLQLWNLIRAVDFLSELEYVDSQRIGCTGASGGGTQTFMLTAVDQRIRVAAPVNMISLFMHGGCACENAPMLRIDADNVEIAALAAPRPMLMVSATGDWTSETPQVEYPAVRRVYELYGAADKVESVHVDAPHNYNAESRAHVYRFFARHLLNRPDLDVSTLEVPLPCSLQELRLYPKHPRPRRVLRQEELFEQVKAAHRARARSLSPAALREQLERLLHWQAPALDGLQVRVIDEASEESGGRTRLVRRLTLGTRRRQETIPVLLSWEKGMPLREVSLGGRSLAWPQPQQTPRLVVGNSGAAAEEHTGVVCRLEPFLTGSYLTPASQSGRNTGVWHFEGYNLTDAAWRALDIALGANWLELVLGVRPHLDAYGEAGPWGLLAMALTPAICSASLDVEGLADTEESLIQRLYVPHLLRLGGLGALLRLCAPRPLTLRQASPELEVLAREAYAGAGEALKAAGL